MKRTSFTDEQIIGFLTEHEAGATYADLCRKHSMFEGTFYNWGAKYGDMTVSDAKRLKAPKGENEKLKTLLTEQRLDLAAMKELVSKKMVTPAVRRETVAYLKARFGLSERRACRIARWSATSRSVRLIQSCVVGCGSWLMNRRSATGGSSCYCAASESLQGSTGSIGSTATKS